LAVIGLVCGVPSNDMREQLAPLLWGCFVTVIVCGALFVWQRRRLAHRLRVIVGEREMRLELAHAGGTETLLSPVIAAHGKAMELVSGGKGHRSVPVLWVRVDGGGQSAYRGRTSSRKSIIVKRAQGILDAVPNWPDVPRPTDLPTYSSVALDPIRLHASLAQRS
jgi:hypothetical protein